MDIKQTIKSNVKHKKWFLPVLIILVAGLLFAVLFVLKPRSQLGEVQERVWPVEVQTVYPGPHTANVVLFGEVESLRNAVLTAAIEADVLATPVKEGSTVTKDQIIIKLDEADAALEKKQQDAEVALLKAQIAAELVRYDADKKALKEEQHLVELSEQAVARQQKLKHSEFVSQQALDQTEETLHERQIILTQRQQAVNDHQNRLAQLHAQQAKAEAKAARAALDVVRSTIRSPFDGRLAKLLASVGDRVRPGNELAELYDLSTLEVRAEIPSQYVAGLRAMLSQKTASNGLTATVPTLHYGKVELHLERLAAKVSQGRSGVEGLFIVTEGADQLTLGSTVELLLELPKQQNSVLLPAQALFDLKRVYKVVDQRLVAVQVERLGSAVSAEGVQQVLIRSSELKAGDKVLITALPHAISGLKVRVLEPSSNLIKTNKKQ